MSVVDAARYVLKEERRGWIGQEGRVKRFRGPGKSSGMKQVCNHVATFIAGSSRRREPTPCTRTENSVHRVVLRVETRRVAFSVFVIRAYAKVAAARSVEFRGFVENPISTNFTGGRDPWVWQPFRLPRLPATRRFPEALTPSERGENV